MTVKTPMTRGCMSARGVGVDLFAGRGVRNWLAGWQAGRLAGWQGGGENINGVGREQERSWGEMME